MNLPDLALMTPGVAAAARHFLTPLRPPPTDEERALLAGATCRPVLTPRGDVTTYAWGHGQRSVLIVHGWNSHAGQMSAFVGSLLAAGRRVVAFDAPGHGASPGAISHVPAFADAVAAVAAALGPIDGVVAHSGGALACAAAAARGTSLGPMVWIAPVASLRAFARAAATNLGIEAPSHPLFLAAIEEIVEVPFDELDLEVAADGRGRVSIIHDQSDRLVPIDAIRRASRALGAQLHETSGLGHARLLRDPGTVARAVAYLDAHDGAADVRR